MDKSRIDILSEIKESLEALKAQVSEIEARIAAIEAEPEPEESDDIPETEEDMNPIDISLDVDMDTLEDIPSIQAEPEPEPTPEPVIPEPEPEPVIAEPEPGPTPEPVSPEPEPEPVIAEPKPVEEPEEESVFDMPKENINDKQERKSKKAVMDVMGAKCAWKTAMPGTPVKNIISAISLNDRVLFINTLFKENPMAFQEAISAFNGMSSFAEAEEYVQANYPEWNLNSDIVYRLMMAIRRKLK